MLCFIFVADFLEGIWGQRLKEEFLAVFTVHSQGAAGSHRQGCVLLGALQNGEIDIKQGVTVTPFFKAKGS